MTIKRTSPEKVKNSAYKFMLILILSLLCFHTSIVSGQTRENKIYIISIDGEITPAMASFLDNKIANANAEGADGIIIEITTLGGRVDSAIKMRDSIIASDTQVVVFIKSRAISAGALISIASDTIIMAPGSHIGAAQPIPNDPKTLAFVSGEFRTTAERTGRDPEIAVAMVDESIEIEGLIGSGAILDMTANEAYEHGYADYISANIDEVLSAMKWDNAVIIEETPDFRYKIAQFLTSYEVASILLTLGMLALIAEFSTQGFGIVGGIGIACFALYFTSGFLAGNTDWWAALIFVIGLILLVIEFIVPGFGIFGISGIIAIVIGIIFAAPTIGRGIFSLLISISVTIIFVPIFIKIFGKTRFMQRLVLAHSETVESGYVHTTKRDSLLGREGVSKTVLRPSGSIYIDGIRIDAMSDGDFIEKDVKVKIIREEGSKVIVTPLDNAPPE